MDLVQLAKFRLTSHPIAYDETPSSREVHCPIPSRLDFFPMKYDE